jgi:hypothetical protein
MKLRNYSTADKLELKTGIGTPEKTSQSPSLIALPKEAGFVRVASHGTRAERKGLQPSLRGFDGERRPHVGAARRQDPLFEILRFAQNDN